MAGKHLILTVGLPRSGKSTWSAAQTANGCVVVNPDSIRLALHGQPHLPEREQEVWHIAHIMVESLFLAGHNTVILDATNLTNKRRAEWISDKWNTSCVSLFANAAICKQRALDSGKEYLVPVIERMAKHIEWPVDGRP